MRSKELFQLLMLYLTEEYKKLYASDLLQKLQELKDRLAYLTIQHIEYALKYLEEQGIGIIFLIRISKLLQVSKNELLKISLFLVKFDV